MEKSVPGGKNTALKIIIPALILVTIIGIWALKTTPWKKSNDETATKESVSASSVEETDKTTEPDGTVTANSNAESPPADSPDYALAADDNINLKKLKSYGLPIIIEFGAEWCGPCQIMAPIIEELNKELRGKAIVKYYDTDKNQTFAQNYNFQYIPTQLFIQADGTPFNPSDAAEREIETYNDPQTGEHLFTTHTGTLTKQELMDILKEMGMK